MSATPRACGGRSARSPRSWGGWTCWSNNAGIERRAAFLDLAPQDWQRQLAVNLSGTFHCTQAAVREMAQRSYGRIVNLASVAGLIGPIDLAAYGAAKAGIIGLTGPPRSGSVPRSS